MIESHEAFTPKVKMFYEGDGVPPVVLKYCSDACSEGLKGGACPDGHDVRDADMFRNRSGERRWGCYACGKSYPDLDVGIK